MKIVCIIQARTGSSRLPKKVLMPIGSEEMILRVIKQVRASLKINEIVLATSDKVEDDVLEKVVKRAGIPVFRGSELDVLDRYYRAAHKFGADVIVRVTGDCPLIDPAIIDSVIDKFLSVKDCDYASNVITRSFPRGLDVEIFSRRVLDLLWSSCKLPDEREHVTIHVLRNKSKFLISEVISDVDLSNLRLTVDESADLELVREIYAKFSGKIIHLGDILNILSDFPALKKINAHIEQKKY